MRRSTATAIWNGKLKNGGGNVTLELEAKLES